MKTLLNIFALACISFAAIAAEPKDPRLFELRIYYAAPDKLDNLQARFRDHTMKLFEKHGMENVGYWLPLTNSENKLVYLLAHKSADAREKSWKAFGADPEWQAVVKASEANGRLVTRADAILMKATDFSPAVKPHAEGGPRTYELRTYTAAPGKLNALLARFRDHTVALFAKHGMEQFGYWTPTEEKNGAGQKLIYILEHKSPEACAESFKQFRADPAWVKAKADSESDGPLTATNGVKSELMKATDCSPAK